MSATTNPRLAVWVPALPRRLSPRVGPPQPPVGPTTEEKQMDPLEMQIAAAFDQVKDANHTCDGETGAAKIRQLMAAGIVTVDQVDRLLAAGMTETVRRLEAAGP